MLSQNFFRELESRTQSHAQRENGSAEWLSRRTDQRRRRRRRHRANGTTAANPTASGGTASPGAAAADVWISGESSNPKRVSGQTMTAALPMTSSTAMVPEYLSPTCMRESADAERWSPITHRRPSGTFTGPKERDSIGLFSKM